MKKYVNGKLHEMTEADLKRRASHQNHHIRSNENTPDYATKIQELENTVAILLAKLAETEEQDRGE